MNARLEFTTEQKHHLELRLMSGETLNIFLPRRATIRKLVTVSKTLSDTTEASIDELYDMTAILLSTNDQGKTFTADDVDAMFDLEDLVKFIKGFMSFIQEVTASPN